MKRCLLLFLCIIAATYNAHATSPNPYAGQEMREIKAMSPEDIQSYLTGKGMGLAKAAELNGYPGPSHVLSLAPKLGLSSEQQKFTKALFVSMETEAINAGSQLVEEERKLDQLFAAKQVTPETLNASLGKIASLQARVRAAHLDAHLEQVRILTPDQTALYNELRGYSSPQATSRKHHQ